MSDSRLIALLSELSVELADPSAESVLGPGLHRELSYALCAYRQRVPAEQGADQATEAAR